MKELYIDIAGRRVSLKKSRYFPSSLTSYILVDLVVVVGGGGSCKIIFTSQVHIINDIHNYGEVRMY